MAIIKNDKEAPDFTLNTHNDEKFTLSEFKGKKVLLSFHPLAWTRVCTRQMESLEQHYSKFEELNAIAVGISVDAVPSKKAWADEMQLLNTALLSDFWPHGKVAEMYGIFREKQGFSERANILLDEKGIVIFSKKYPISELPDIDEVIRAMEK